MSVGNFLQVRRSSSGNRRGSRGGPWHGYGMVREQVNTPAASAVTLDALRQATAGRHAAIESLLGLRGAFGRTHYGRVIQGFDAFLAIWQLRMLRALPERLHPRFARAPGRPGAPGPGCPRAARGAVAGQRSGPRGRALGARLAVRAGAARRWAGSSSRPRGAPSS